MLDQDYSIEAQEYMEQQRTIEPSSLDSLLEQMFIQEVIRQWEVDQFSP